MKLWQNWYGLKAWLLSVSKDDWLRLLCNDLYYLCIWRCQDRTEGGTHFSSILCPGCQAPSPPLQAQTGSWSWLCPACGRETPRSLVDSMLDRLDCQPAGQVQELEEILLRFSQSPIVSTVHHYHMTSDSVTSSILNIPRWWKSKSRFPKVSSNIKWTKERFPQSLIYM